MDAPICRVCGMRHWGGDHVWPRGATSHMGRVQKAEPAKTASSQADPTGPEPDERSLAPRESPSAKVGKGKKPKPNKNTVVIPVGEVVFCDADDKFIAIIKADPETAIKKAVADAIATGSGVVRLTADGIEHIPSTTDAASSSGKTPTFDVGNVGSNPAVASNNTPSVESTLAQPMKRVVDKRLKTKVSTTVEDKSPTPTVVDETSHTTVEDKPAKPDRKAYQQQYMARRREKEREAKRIAAKGGTNT